MGRPVRFSEDAMLDAAADLLLEGGPSALTAAGVARRLAAPSGSVYHRFATRDHLAALLWMRTVERFDSDVVAGLRDHGGPVDVAVAIATSAVSWCAENPTDAYILTMFRREDLMTGGFPSDLAARAETLGDHQRESVAHLAHRLDLPEELVSFAVAGIPLAAVRRYVNDQTEIPAWVSAAVERATRAALHRTR